MTPALTPTFWSFLGNFLKIPQKAGFWKRAKNPVSRSFLPKRGRVAGFLAPKRSQISKGGFLINITIPIPHRGHVFTAPKLNVEKKALPFHVFNLNPQKTPKLSKPRRSIRPKTPVFGRYSPRLLPKTRLLEMT